MLFLTSVKCFYTELRKLKLALQSKSNLTNSIVSYNEQIPVPVLSPRANWKS